MTNDLHDLGEWWIPYPFPVPCETIALYEARRYLHEWEEADYEVAKKYRVILIEVDES